jgi:hypothetical protein
MHVFDLWLIDRLTATGALIYGDAEPDVPAALRLYQKSECLPVSGLACNATVNMLRRRKSPNPDSPLIIFHPAPSSVGSRFAVVPSAKELCA